MHKLISLVLVAGLAACSRDAGTPSSSSSSSSSVAPTAPSASNATAPGAALPAGLSRVQDPSKVCMVNDQFMGTPQIPVEVEGRTYYGCCPMCKDRLGKEPATRTAQDPVTGEQVDKSRAVIIQDAAGKILYFASEDTLRRYRG